MAVHNNSRPMRWHCTRSFPLASPPALVLLAVKSGATAEAAAQLGATLPAGTPVVSMQNGLSNTATAQAAAPALRVLAGMVPFNIAELAPGHYHRGTVGELAAQDDTALRAHLAAFERAGPPLQLHADLRAVQWGKLLLNLNNPVNALSGLPLRAQLMERGYRKCLAALQSEALGLLHGAGIAPAQVAALPPQRIPTLLRLPTPLFRLIAARMLRIDPKARSSMADDLTQGRTTEIDALCGEVVRLAAAHGRSAPLNARMVELVNAWPKRPLAMDSFASDVVPFTQARANLSELADQAKAGAEKIITKNGASYVALIDADRLDYYHRLERERIHLLLIDDARRGLADIAAGRTQDADATIAKLQQRRAAARAAPKGSKKRS